MREIKFRAWNKKEKNFITWDLNFAFGGTGEIWGSVEQYTGLKAKNGKEIYEGDIVSNDCYPFIDDGIQNYIGIVEFIEGSFCYTLKVVNDKKRGISDGIAENLICLHEPEIVGNIHEHKNLLDNSS